MDASRLGRSIGPLLFEVTLIVIGVLIALQVDNWNEQRKETELELSILGGIQNDLQGNADRLREMIEGDVELITGNEYLLSIIRDPASIYHEELNPLFGSINRYDTFYPLRLSYETLRERGLEIVQNKILRSRIAYLYDFSYMVNNEIEMGIKQSLYEDSNRVFLRHLDTGKEVYLKWPRNFDLLKADEEFVNHLAHITAEQKTMLFFAERRLDETLAVLNLVREEIEILSPR